MRVGGPADILAAKCSVVARWMPQAKVKAHEFLKTCHAQDFVLFVGRQVLKLLHLIAGIKMPAHGGRIRNYESNFQYAIYCPMCQNFIF